MKRPTIIQAIESKRVFGSLPRFRSLDTWASWLVVLKAIFGLPMTPGDLVVFHTHTGRASPPLGGAKETYLIIGRRGGKSFISALITCFVSCFGDFREFITVGETLAVMCLARDKEQARIVFKYVKAILNHVPVLRAMIAAERNDEIELSTGVTVMVKASDFGGVRGPTIACVICDELAFWPSEGLNPDSEVLAAIRPAMATIPNSKLLCISTAYGQTGSLFDMHKKYFGKDDDEVLVWTADTHSMNPTISQTFVDKEIERDPEAGRAEWLGQFREDVSAAFPLEAIEACIVPGRSELLPSVHIGPYFGFVDPSGGRADSFTAAVAHVHKDGERLVIDAIRATKPPFDPAVVTKEFSGFLKLYGVTGVFGDNYGGEWPKAEFAKNGINYELSELHKSDLYLNLIPVLCSRKVELLDNEKLKNELRRLERRRGRSGRDTIDHPPRGSDDIANAVAGVIWLTSEHVGRFVMPEAYGQRICTDWNFYMEGLGTHTPDRYW
jgi:Phage Terminase